ncbi:MAG: diguanylate cyclase [Chitinivibrionales bacterium]|nr:diguanylate cyclase [Chitinivibrionales bacterium]
MMTAKIAGTVLNILLGIGLIWMIVGSNSAGLLSQNVAMVALAVLIIAGCFIAALLYYYYNRREAMEPWIIIALGMLTGAGIHLCLPAITQSAQDQFLVRTAFYCVPLLLAGGLGSATALFATLGILLAVSLLSLIAACGVLSAHGINGAYLAAAAPLMPRAILTIVIPGALAVLVAAQSALLRRRRREAPPAHRTMPLPAQAAEKSPAETPPPEISSQTNHFTIEYLSDLGQHSLDNLLSSVVYFMSRNFKAYSALGFIYEPQRKVFALNAFHSTSTAIIPNVEIPLGKGFVGRIGTEKHSFLSGDLSMYNFDILYYSGGEMVNAILTVPITSEQNELLGALVVDSKEKYAFTDYHKDAIKRFSFLAAALITNVRMRVRQEQTAKQLKIFYEASQRYISALSVDAVFEVLANMVTQLTNCIRTVAIVFNRATETGTIRKIHGTPHELAEGFEFPITAGLYSFALQKRKVVNVGDFSQYAGKFYRFTPEETPPPWTGSLIILPILDDEARCLGLFSVESDRPYAFTGEIEQVLSTLVGNTAVSFTRAVLYQHMETLATTDGLTQLNNHRTFQEQLSKELARAKRYKRPLALILMDIDHFKVFNDTYGHTVGDLVLKEIALCIKSAIRASDFPARYGGEEFTVILPETPQDGALIMAERIRKTIENHVVHSLEKELHVTVSLGVALFPEHAETQPLLIESADKALYQSKEQGRNRVTLFQK